MMCAKINYIENMYGVVKDMEEKHNLKEKEKHMSAIHHYDESEDFDKLELYIRLKRDRNPFSKLFAKLFGLRKWIVHYTVDLTSKTDNPWNTSDRTKRRVRSHFKDYESAYEEYKEGCKIVKEMKKERDKI